jgi:hypothetical protein
MGCGKKKFRNTLLVNNPVDVDWGLVVKLALPGKVTRHAYTGLFT